MRTPLPLFKLLALAAGTAACVMLAADENTRALVTAVISVTLACL